MKKQTKATLAGLTTSIVVALLFAFVGWCSGYDFDHRNEAVGFVVMMTALAAIGAGLLMAASISDSSDL